MICHSRKFYSYFLLFIAFAFSLIAGHDSCDNCHGRFPNTRGKGKGSPPARIPADKVDVLCLGCHGPAGISMFKADTHGTQNHVISTIVDSKGLKLI